jgi:hypothetical protein
VLRGDDLAERHAEADRRAKEDGRMVRQLCLMCTAVLTLLLMWSGSALAAGAVSSQSQTVGPALQAWQHWRLDREGYPEDRRLLQPVDLQQAHLTVAELLAAAQQQTGVSLEAHEPELRAQQVTAYVGALPLNALMVQLKELLGLFWYERAEGGARSYVVTYGGVPPSAQAADQAQAEYQRQRRADRIAGILRASEMSQPELRKLGETDPLLATEFIGSGATQSRLVAETLRGMAPGNLRALIDTGLATASGNELPTWFREKLHADYAESQETYARLGITSADDTVARWRVRFFDNGDMDLQTGEMRELMGTVWGGINWAMGTQKSPNSPAPRRPSARPEAADITIIGFDIGDAWCGGVGSFPGKVEHPDVVARQCFGPWPEDDPAERAKAQLAEVRAREERSLHTSQWSGKAALAAKPSFPLAPDRTVAQVLAAISEQTGYTVLGTYFDDHDAKLPRGASAEEPIYVLLNRMAKEAKCSWALAGTVLRWRHDDWFLLESSRKSRPKEATDGARQ